MATEVLYGLQRVLSETDFDTIEAFISLYNEFEPETSGQTRVCFQLFVENIEKRYNRKFDDCHVVLSIRLEDVEQQLIENELKLSSTNTSEAGKRRDEPYILKDSRFNDDDRAMHDWFASLKHTHELAKAATISNVAERNAAVQKECERHANYQVGQPSTPSATNEATM